MGLFIYHRPRTWLATIISFTNRGLIMNIAYLPGLSPSWAWRLPVRMGCSRTMPAADLRTQLPLDSKFTMSLASHQRITPMSSIVNRTASHLYS